MGKGRDNQLLEERDKALLGCFRVLVSEGLTFKDIFVTLKNEFYISEDTVLMILKRNNLTE
jgi:hypothetical protein